MSAVKRFAMRTAVLGAALLSMGASVSPDAKTARESRMPVAIAQPLGAVDSRAIIALPESLRAYPALPESATLVLVGTGLIGLASLVRRTT